MREGKGLEDTGRRQREIRPSWVPSSVWSDCLATSAGLRVTSWKRDTTRLRIGGDSRIGGEVADSRIGGYVGGLAEREGRRVG
jgi:hypothetical protein